MAAFTKLGEYVKIGQELLVTSKGKYHLRRGQKIYLGRRQYRVKFLAT
jgi:hypothetical protein